MFDLERIEKRLILFLAATLLLGVGASAYLRSRPAPAATVGRFSPAGAASDARLPRRDLRTRININAASAGELAELKGVGKAIAARIVGYRDAHGLFVMVEEIKKVDGVGPALYEKIRDEITVD